MECKWNLWPFYPLRLNNKTPVQKNHSVTINFWVMDSSDWHWWGQKFKKHKTSFFKTCVITRNGLRIFVNHSSTLICPCAFLQRTQIMKYFLAGLKFVKFGALCKIWASALVSRSLKCFRSAPRISKDQHQLETLLIKVDGNIALSQKILQILKYYTQLKSLSSYF